MHVNTKYLGTQQILYLHGMHVHTEYIDTSEPHTCTACEYEISRHTANRAVMHMQGFVANNMKASVQTPYMHGMHVSTKFLGTQQTVP
jgi:hypothetical protein